MENVKIIGKLTINNVELVKVFDRINRNLLTVNKKVGIFEEVLPKIAIHKNRVTNEIIDKYSLNSSYECCVKIITYEKVLKKDLEEELVKEYDNIIKTIDDIVKENIKKYKESTIILSDEQRTRENKAYKSITNMIDEIKQIKKYNIQIIEYYKNLIEKNEYTMDLS